MAWGDNQDMAVMRQILNLLWEKSSNLEVIQSTYERDNEIIIQRLETLEKTVESLVSELATIKQTLRNDLYPENKSVLESSDSLQSHGNQLLRQSEVELDVSCDVPRSLSSSVQDILGE